MTPNARILLVEDDRALRRALAAGLLHAGYLVTTAVDGEEALRIVDRMGCFDIVVLDYGLGAGARTGGQTGLELQQLCRAMPLIFVTGYQAAEMDAALDLADEGRHIVLQKPVTNEQLLEAIEALLREPPGQ